MSVDNKVDSLTLSIYYIKTVPNSSLFPTYSVLEKPPDKTAILLTLIHH